MKTKLLAIASLAAAFLLPSCFQQESTIHLNKDGSGTIVEEVKLGAQMIEMIGQMAAMGGEDAKKEDPLKNLASEEKAKERAEKMGEGVTVEKVEKIGENGARTTYRFKDINKIKVNQSGGMDDLMNSPGMKVEKKEEPLAFKYADGTLTFAMPQPKKAEGDGEKDAEKDAAAAQLEDPQAMEMMKQMFGDMKMAVKLVIEPGIAESNATHVDGNTVTLMEMDMGKLMKNEEAFKKLAKMGNEADPKKIGQVLKGVDGVKVETNENISIKVK